MALALDPEKRLLASGVTSVKLLDRNDESQPLNVNIVHHTKYDVLSMAKEVANASPKPPDDVAGKFEAVEGSGTKVVCRDGRLLDYLDDKPLPLWVSAREQAKKSLENFKAKFDGISVLQDHVASETKTGKAGFKFLNTENPTQLEYNMDDGNFVHSSDVECAAAVVVNEFVVNDFAIRFAPVEDQLVVKSGVVERSYPLLSVLRFAADGELVVPDETSKVALDIGVGDDSTVPPKTLVVHTGVEYVDTPLTDITVEGRPTSSNEWWTPDGLAEPVETVRWKNDANPRTFVFRRAADVIPEGTQLLRVELKEDPSSQPVVVPATVTRVDYADDADSESFEKRLRFATVDSFVDVPFGIRCFYGNYNAISNLRVRTGQRVAETVKKRATEPDNSYPIEDVEVVPPDGEAGSFDFGGRPWEAEVVFRQAEVKALCWKSEGFYYFTPKSFEVTTAPTPTLSMDIQCGTAFAPKTDDGNKMNNAFIWNVKSASKALSQPWSEQAYQRAYWAKEIRLYAGAFSANERLLTFQSKVKSVTFDQSEDRPESIVAHLPIVLQAVPPTVNSVTFKGKDSHTEVTHNADTIFGQVWWRILLPGETLVEVKLEGVTAVPEKLFQTSSHDGRTLKTAVTVAVDADGHLHVPDGLSELAGVAGDATSARLPASLRTVSAAALAALDGGEVTVAVDADGHLHVPDGLTVVHVELAHNDAPLRTASLPAGFQHVLPHGSLSGVDATVR